MHIKTKIKDFLNESQELDIRKLRDEKQLKIGDIYPESDVYQYIENLHNHEDFEDGDIGERIEEFSEYKVCLIDINKINMDEYQLDDNVVAEYIETYKNSKAYPPIVLGDLESWGYNIIDGTHRANAFRDLGLTEIICFVGV